MDVSSALRDVSDKMVTAIASNLIAHGVIIPTGHWQLDYHLTRKGRLIVEKGGWASYLDKEEKRLEKEAEKLDWDLKNSKWYHWSRWWPLGLSIVSLLLSGGKIYYDLQQDKHEEQSPTQSIQSQTGTHKTISPSDSIEDDQATSSQNEPNQPLPDSGNEWNLNELDIKAQHANKG